MSEDEYNTLYHNMLTSVYKNKGFYIGRYEMGIGVATSADDEGDDTSATNLARTSSSKEYTANSKILSSPYFSITSLNCSISCSVAISLP